jgi:hypothetical protein
MTEQEVQHSLRLVRYGGIVVTVIVLVVLIGFVAVAGGALGATGNVLSSMLGYIIGFTVFAAVLSVALYFGYRAYLMGRMKTS